VFGFAAGTLTFAGEVCGMALKQTHVHDQQASRGKSAAPTPMTPLMSLLPLTMLQ